MIPSRISPSLLADAAGPLDVCVLLFSAKIGEQHVPAADPDLQSAIVLRVLLSGGQRLRIEDVEVNRHAVQPHIGQEQRTHRGEPVLAANRGRMHHHVERIIARIPGRIDTRKRFHQRGHAVRIRPLHGRKILRHFVSGTASVRRCAGLLPEADELPGGVARRLVEAAARVRTPVDPFRYVARELRRKAVRRLDAVAVLVPVAQNPQPQLFMAVPVGLQDVAEFGRRQLPALVDIAADHRQRIDRGGEPGFENRRNIVDRPVRECVARRLETVPDCRGEQQRRVDLVQRPLEIIHAPDVEFDDPVELPEVGGQKIVEGPEPVERAGLLPECDSGQRIDAVVQYQFNRFQHIQVPDAGRIAECARHELVAAADVAGPRLLRAEAAGRHRAGDAGFADEHDAVVPAPNHVERTVQKLRRRIRRGFDLDFRRMQSEPVVLLENQVRKFADLRGTVGLRSAEIERVAPVVVDRRPLHQEVADEFGISTNGVKKHIMKALRLIREEFGIKKKSREVPENEVKTYIPYKE